MPDAGPAASALDGIRAAEQAATPGPWHLEWDSCDCGDGYGCSHGSCPHAIHTSRAHTERLDGQQRDYDFSHTEICELGDADAEFIIAARDATPRLLAAVDAALAFHEESGGSCGSCLDAYGDRIEWPCEEYRAITAELTEIDSAPAGAVKEDGGHG